MPTTCPKPSTALALRLLVPIEVRKRLGWRVSFDCDLMDEGTDACITQVGPPQPYRLLVLSAEDGGLIRYQLWRVGKRLTVEADRKCLAELLPDMLTKLSVEFKLS